MHSLARMDLADSFGALLVGWLVIVARGLYLARHLFTLLYYNGDNKTISDGGITVDFWFIKVHTSN